MMAVEVARQEPLTPPPPIEEIVVVGNASQRGFTAKRNYIHAGGLMLRGCANGGKEIVPDPHGWTLSLNRKDALELLEALVELVG